MHASAKEIPRAKPESQRSPEGYLKIMAVLQKYIDQGISVNTSYNPEFYEEEKETWT